MHPARVGAGEYDGDLKSGGNHRQKLISGETLKIALLLAVAIIACNIFLNQYTYPIDFFHKSNSFSHTKLSSSSSSSSENCDTNSSSFHQSTSPERDENRELEETLSKAAMENRTVILTTLNTAWTEPNSIFDLFLEGFRIGNGTAELLKHVVVGAFDQTAYERCLAKGLHCYAVTTEGVNFSGEAFYMTEDYLKMTWRKVHFQRTVLELGYDFVFTDADVMWLRNPIERFYLDGDFQVACDHYWAEYKDMSNSPNTGFNYVKSNNRTIQFYRFWYTAQYYFPGKHDQDVFNFIKDNPFIPQIGLDIRFLDTALFGGFCEPSKDLDWVITMHANCCIGLDNKIHDIKMVIDDWKRYMSIVDERNSTIRSWTVPRICG